MWVGITQPAEDPMEEMMEEGGFSLLSILLPTTFHLVSSAIGLSSQLLCFGMTLWNIPSLHDQVASILKINLFCRALCVLSIPPLWENLK